MSGRAPTAHRTPATLLRLAAWVLVVFSFTGPSMSAQAGADTHETRRRYQPPLVAPIADPFRPPPEPWLAGNRGIEYETVPGSRVGAIGPGQVVFAGPVAGTLHVTILHPDGLRSSYSFLAAIHVRLGQRLATGATVGVTGELFHVGVRSGGAYIDPASLWGKWVRGGLVMLVPIEGPASAPSRPGPMPGLAPPVPGRAVADGPPWLDPDQPAVALAARASRILGHRVAEVLASAAVLGPVPGLPVHSFVGPPPGAS